MVKGDCKSPQMATLFSPPRLPDTLLLAWRPRSSDYSSHLARRRSATFTAFSLPFPGDCEVLKYCGRGIVRLVPYAARISCALLLMKGISRKMRLAYLESAAS